MLIQDLFFSACVYLSLCDGSEPISPESVDHGQLYNLTSREVAETSGMAASRLQPGELWLHNDSGNDAKLYRFDPSNDKLTKTVSLNGAESDDWEDMASFQWDGKNWLLVADVGDNFSNKQHVQLYLLPEPNGTAEEQQVDVVTTYTLRFEDGPRDCEAIAVDPDRQRLWLLSKRDKPGRLYSAPLDQGSDIFATFAGEAITIPEPTADDIEQDPWYGGRRWQASAMDISPDGQQLLITTYKDSYIYQLQASDQGNWGIAISRPPLVVDTPQLMQTEAGAFSHDGEHVWVASEQLPTQLFQTQLTKTTSTVSRDTLSKPR
jgi:hypothetical protein